MDDRKTHWKKTNWHQIIALTVAFVWVAMFFFRYVSPSARYARSILQALSDQDVISISVEPARAGYPSVVEKAITVDDKKDISSFVAAFSGMKPYSPNHPNIIQAVTLRMRLREGQVGGYLEGMSDGGAIFYCMSDVNKGWVYGTYLITSDKKIFNLIEDAVKNGRAH